MGNNPRFWWTATGWQGTKHQAPIPQLRDRHPSHRRDSNAKLQDPTSGEASWAPEAMNTDRFQ